MPQSKKSVDTDDRVDQVAKMRAAGYIPANEIASKMGIARTTVWKWVQNKEVASQMVARHLYVRLDSLIAHIGEEQAKIFGFSAAAVAKKAGGAK